MQTIIDTLKDILYFTRKLEAETDPALRYGIEQHLSLLEDRLVNQRQEKEEDVNRTI